MACIFYNMPYVFFAWCKNVKKRDFVVGKTKIKPTAMRSVFMYT